MQNTITVTILTTFKLNCECDGVRASVCEYVFVCVYARACVCMPICISVCVHAGVCEFVKITNIHILFVFRNQTVVPYGCR